MVIYNEFSRRVGAALVPWNIYGGNALLGKPGAHLLPVATGYKPHRLFHAARRALADPALEHCRA